MKTWKLVLMVVLLHCTAICALFVLQGCGTPGARKPVPPAVIMPPLTPPGEPLPSPREYAEPDTKTYTVKPGDNISIIAQRYRTSQAEIAALNNLADPNRIRVGQKLLLPGYVDLERPAQKLPAPAEPAVDSGNVYVVQPMDSISKIARRLKVSEDELVKLNELPNRNRIRVGQKLLIPDSAVAPAPEDTETRTIPGVRGEVKSPISIFEEPAGTFVFTEIFHTVEPGQDLRSVARMYSVTVEELAELNGLSPGDKVEAGRRLKIP